MSAPTSPTSPPQDGQTTGRRRASSVAQSITSFTEDLVMNRDPPLGFFAASAAATSKAPTVKDVRRGSFGEDGWQARGSRRSTRSSRRRSSGSKDRPSTVERDGHGQVETFAPLTEESTRVSSDLNRLQHAHADWSDFAAVEEENNEYTAVDITGPAASRNVGKQRTDHDGIVPSTEQPASEAGEEQSLQTSDFDGKSKTPWTTSTWIGLKAFWKWFLTPFGFFLTIYGLNVVAWGGMLFLLLCNASKYMCWAPVHNKENQKHMGDIAALNLPGPYYFNCNDINSPRRIWIEIDSQILNALFCVTGFGLAPWRFRDLYYLLKWRFTSWKSGRENKMYGLRKLAGIHKGWFRLPGSETLDTTSTTDYLRSLEKASNADKTSADIDMEANASSGLLSEPQNDVRIPLPLSKKPADPPTSVRAPPTPPWKLDFFIWCMAWNTFFQCCLCGFMWGMDRYARPPWSTGLFVALACIIAGVGGVVSYKDGRKIKRIEGVPPKPEEQSTDGGEGSELTDVKTHGTGHESVHLFQSRKEKVIR